MNRRLPSSQTLLASGEFRRLCLYSAIGHLLVVGSLWAAGLRTWASRVDPAPIFVDVVAAAPAPEPAARPAPQREKPVVIPRKPRPKPKPKPKPQVEPEPEPAEAPAPTAQQLLAQIRTRVGSVAPNATPSPAAGAGGRFDPELARYRQKVMVLLRTNWVGGRAFAAQPGLEVHYEVRIDGQGGIRSVSILHPSGNRYYDESAERAIQKSAPFPSPPRGPLTLDVRFQPGSVL